MVNKKYYWLRLKDNFFKQKEIKKLRKIAGGDTYTVIYLKLQLLSMQTEGKLLFEGVEDSFAEEIALELDEDVNNVEMTLAFLQKHNLIMEIEQDEFLLPETLECIGSESASTQRSRKSREKKKRAIINDENHNLLQCNTNATKCNTEIEKEEEREKEKDIYSSSSEISNEEELKEIMKICNKLNFKLKTIDAKQFIELFGFNKVKQGLIIISKTNKYMNGDIKNPNSYLAATLQDLSRDKKVEVTVTKDKLKFNNYKQREDMTKEEEDELLGW